MNRLPDQSKQYRFLKYNNNWFLRAITSKRYNNYDNHIAIYTTLVALDNYADVNNKKLFVGDSYLTDSEIKLNIHEDYFYIVDEDVYVQFGFFTSNNELTEGAFSLELSYKVFNLKTEKFKGLSNYIFNFPHTISLEKLEKEFLLAKNIEEFKQEIIKFIKQIYEEELSENQIYSIFKEITSTKNKLHQETKLEAEKIKDESVGNKINLLELFERLNEIIVDVHEKIYLERIYHTLIKDISSSTKPKIKQ